MIRTWVQLETVSVIIKSCCDPPCFRETYSCHKCEYENYFLLECYYV
jgi:hypothetical protein